MKPPSNRVLRRQLAHGHKLVDEQIGPAVNQLLSNEQYTKKKLDAFDAFCAMTLAQRLRWLFRGVR